MAITVAVSAEPADRGQIDPLLREFHAIGPQKLAARGGRHSTSMMPSRTSGAIRAITFHLTGATAWRRTRARAFGKW
ncbi:hypothetical protein [Tabrizicola sp.]|uniref:hypothetical protein n=1 Tax=Tabrizicola sp. TaxID=2005166 RepID=UPI00260BE26D|nr:hypothetical protein [Tabrizicola sp.]MDM7933603.1 hypothetical protein [Tabrizicola sp.]